MSSERDTVELAAARASGDPQWLARVALDQAGGDLGCGWEVGINDVASAALLREALAALGDRDPLLALRMACRLVHLLVASDRDEEMTALAGQAERLGASLGDPEARALALLVRIACRYARGAEPLQALDAFAEAELLLALAERSGRTDLQLRALLFVAADHYVHGRMEECDLALSRAQGLAADGSALAWEVDLSCGLRCVDRGDRTGAETLIRRAGARVRQRRPDIHIAVEMVGLLISEWVFEGSTGIGRMAYEATQRAMPYGFVAAFIAFSAALDGDREFAASELRRLLAAGLEPLRRPDGHLPMALWALAFTAAHIDDPELGRRLRRLLESVRGRVLAPLPTVGFGHLVEWHVGRLELLTGNLDAATEVLRAAIAQADRCELVWARGLTRVDLARALHRRGEGDEAADVLAEARTIGREFGIGWIRRGAAEVRAEIDGAELDAQSQPGQGLRRLRSLAARGGRRALAVMIEGLDDAAIERRFAETRNQRALMKAIAQTFQPARANGFRGLVAYELEPFAIEPPPAAPWRWALEIDGEDGDARLVEPAPPAAAATIQIGLAEWVRVIAGVDDALSAIAAGRCRVEGDVVLAVRLEMMFGGA